MTIIITKFNYAYEVKKRTFKRTRSSAMSDRRTSCDPNSSVGSSGKWSGSKTPFAIRQGSPRAGASSNHAHLAPSSVGSLCGQARCRSQLTWKHSKDRQVYTTWNIGLSWEGTISEDCWCTADAIVNMYVQSCVTSVVVKHVTKVQSDKRRYPWFKPHRRVGGRSNFQWIQRQYNWNQGWQQFKKPSDILCVIERIFDK